MEAYSDMSVTELRKVLRELKLQTLSVGKNNRPLVDALSYLIYSKTKDEPYEKDTIAPFFEAVPCRMLQTPKRSPLFGLGG
jgi:hypothetical protein